MLNNPIDEINKRNSECDENEEIKPLFTKSRILFLIVVFSVFLMPLIYRYFTYIL